MKAILIIGVVLAAAEAGLGAQDPLGAAKDLYASAAYEDALSALSRIDNATTAPEIARQVDEYRAFSLYALGRTREAESIAESMIRKEPLAKLDAADVSPRLEMMFTDVRKRLLSSLIREQFRTAKSALDRKSFSTAEPPLTAARLMILEAEELGVKDDGLGDLRLLVDGFLQLIRSASEQRTSAQPALAAAPVDTAVPTVAVALRPMAPVAATAPASDRPSPSASPAPAAVNGARLYSAEDEGVFPPVALDQRMPVMTAEMRVITKAQHATGVVDVVIDETGRVVDAKIRQSLNSTFDLMVARAARRWKYRPAMKDGIAVSYVKTLVLVP